MYLHRELNGLSLGTLPKPLKRWDLSRSLYGSGLWYLGRADAMHTTALLDCDGAGKSFFLDCRRMLRIGGRVMIRHKGISVNGYGTGYPIYANVSAVLIGPYEDQDGMPDLNWDVLDTANLLFVAGQNINGFQDHYFTASLEFQKMIEAGYYRLEIRAGAGSSVSDVDGLGELGDYGAEWIHQLWVTIT